MEEIRKFYLELAKSEKFKASLAQFRKKNGDDYEKIIEKLILPQAKKMGYNFTKGDLLSYEEKNKSDGLSDEDLLNVAGGVWGMPQFAAITLGAIMSLSAAGGVVTNFLGGSKGDSQAMSAAPPTTSYTQTLDDEDTDEEIPEDEQANYDMQDYNFGSPRFNLDKRENLDNDVENEEDEEIDEIKDNENEEVKKEEKSDTVLSPEVEEGADEEEESIEEIKEDLEKAKQKVKDQEDQIKKADLDLNKAETEIEKINNDLKEMEIDEKMTPEEALQEVKDCEDLVRQAEEAVEKNQNYLNELKEKAKEEMDGYVGDLFDTAEEAPESLKQIRAEIEEAEENLKNSEDMLKEHKEKLDKAQKTADLLEEKAGAEIDKGAASVAQGNAMSKLDVATDKEKDLTDKLKEKIKDSITDKVAACQSEYAALGSWLKITLKDGAEALTKDEVQALLEEHKNDNIKYVYFADEQNHFGENLDLGDIGPVGGWNYFAHKIPNVLTLKK